MPTTPALIIVPPIVKIIIATKFPKKYCLFIVKPDSNIIGGSRNKKKYSESKATAFSSRSDSKKNAIHPVIPPIIIKHVDS